MKRPYAARRYVCGSLAAVTAVTSALPMAVMANISSTDFDMRGQAVNLTRVLNVSGYIGQATRGDFARMLMNASGYRKSLPTSNVSVFADVPSAHLDATYIRIAASQGWMTGFLGGLFEPGEYITYKDTVKAALTILGYSDEGFTGDLASSRISRFNYLELNEEVNRRPKEVLSQTDCMNIFYNLLKTKKRDSNETYGAVLDCELNSDGEINPITILDDERKGPVPVRRGLSVIRSVPFDSESANAFLNGTANTLGAVEVSQQDTGFAVVYYNMKSKTIWAYTTREWDDDDLEDSSAYMLLKGRAKNVCYRSTDVMMPTSTRLEIDDDSSSGDFGEDGVDKDGYLTISLSSSELQYLFSIYDGIEVEDEVVMVCNKSGGSYTAIDTIEY